MKLQNMFKKTSQRAHYIALRNSRPEVPEGRVLAIRSDFLPAPEFAKFIAAGTGNCVVRGTIAPLIELGAGFDMDLTARENIFLNGAVLGFTPKYIKEQFDEIVEFSELHEFLDVPLKNYSSGMVARIAFAIATITKPDILIADEILSVGDFLFQQKCEDRMQKLMSGGTTVILVSHSIEQIERMCNKVAWLEHGRIKMNGPTEEVCAAYKHTTRDAE